MEKNNRITLIFLIFFTILDLILFQQKITFRSRASGDTVQLLVKVQGNYRSGTTISSHITIYNPTAIVKEYSDAVLTSVATSNTFSTELDITGLSPTEKYTLLLKPEKGLAKAFCGDQKSGGNCFQSNLVFQKGTTLPLEFDTVLLGDMAVQNGKIDAYDISLIKGSLGKSGSFADVNSNGTVDSEDYSLALFSLGKNASDDKVIWVSQVTPTPTVTVSATPIITPSPFLTSSPTPTKTTTPTPLPTGLDISPTTIPPTPTPTTLVSQTYNKKVLVIVYNPSLTTQNNQKLIQYKQWNDPLFLANQAINWFKITTNNRVNYEIVSSVEHDQWIRKEDGYVYDEATYLDCTLNLDYCHQPDLADYYLLLNQDDICNKFNQGQFDELWLFGAPWFGFYEARLTGPNAYYYNSPPLTNTNCNRLLPIMGFSYERDLNQMIHDFGHRTEATMEKVYGGWQAYGGTQLNSINNNWEKFILVKSKSATYNFSGCGYIHYAPNSVVEYGLTSPDPVDSYCDIFYQYPLLPDALANNLKSVSAATWGNTEIGYYAWWFDHLPRSSGTGPDGKLNDWWNYLLNPDLALGF